VFSVLPLSYSRNLQLPSSIRRAGEVTGHGKDSTMQWRWMSWRCESDYRESWEGRTRSQTLSPEEAVSERTRYIFCHILALCVWDENRSGVHGWRWGRPRFCWKCLHRA
jgi:hypothetical protein